MLEKKEKNGCWDGYKCQRPTDFLQYVSNRQLFDHIATYTVETILYIYIHLLTTTTETMGKSATICKTGQLKCKATPYERRITVVKSEKCVIQDRQNASESAEVEQLLGKLQSIVPTASNSKSICTLDLMEQAINYICDLEEELGFQNVSVLQQNPMFNKIMAMNNI